MLTYDPDVPPRSNSDSITVGVDARALVPETTGIGVYCRAVVDALAAEADVRPLALAHAPIQGLDDRPAIERAVSLSPSGVLWQQFRLNAQLAAHGCDLLWSPIFTLPWSPRLPSVVTVHDLTAWLFPAAHTLKVRISLKPFLRRSIEVANRIITPSRHTAADLTERFPAASGKTVVIPHGVDPEFAPGEQPAITATRCRLGFDDGYFVYSGTLEPRKNVDVLLETWQTLRRADEAPPLVLVGGVGWRAENTLDRIRDLEPLGLRWLGRLPRAEQVEVIQAATAMIFPSLYEGFGFPPLEAMACGIPVISSNSSSLPEVIGDAGLLFDLADGDELARAMRHLGAEAELATDLGRRGLERARSFTWKRSAARHAEVFRQAVSETASGSNR